MFCYLQAQRPPAACGICLGKKKGKLDEFDRCTVLCVQWLPFCGPKLSVVFISIPESDVCGGGSFVLFMTSWPYCCHSPLGPSRRYPGFLPPETLFPRILQICVHIVRPGRGQWPARHRLVPASARSAAAVRLFAWKFS
ncbi:unnamed protein product [Symbiodinium natans]|uniref:Uncharacterized protein n=1 Tax=Symbiodinium natans TaxID=878477 RepID=A0A812IAA3_9DINO|nr:unnamed protein product [Symbiodinium natans]